MGHGGTAPVGRTELVELAAELESVAVERAGRAFMEPEGRPSVWIVQRGRIALYAGRPADRVLVAVLGPGDVDGDLAVLLGMAPPYWAEALEEAEVLRLDGEALDRLLLRHPGLSRRWMASVAHRVSASQRRLVDLLGAPLPVQLARLLLDEADARGDVVFSQALLAAMVGARRPSVNKVLKGFERQGLIELDYRTIRIVDDDGLRRTALRR
ncbi:MAG: Crp/Fnr family transcriptional regulator [Acidimicrobiia bacterium]